MQDPRRYEANNTINQYKKFLPKLIQRMKWSPDEIILDYGCGAGTVTKQYLGTIARNYNSQIYGIDISKNMIDYAEKHSCDSSICYLQGNILSAHEYPLDNI